MSYLQPLLELMEQQEALHRQLIERTTELDADDIVNQNVTLRQQVEELAELSATRQKLLAVLEQDNTKLRLALAGQLYARRDSVLRASRASLQREYDDLQRDGEHRLEHLHTEFADRIAAMRRELDNRMTGDRSALHAQVDQLQMHLDALLAQARQRQAEQAAPLFQKMQEDYAALEQQPLTEEAMRKKAAGENVEIRLGGRIANLAGMLLILLGVIYGLQYSYAHFLTSNTMKSAAAFLLGTAFLAAGELFKGERAETRGVDVRSVRRLPLTQQVRFFSLGITSGGVAILFAATALSHMVLGVLTRTTAFLVCMLIAAAALLLSRRYRSELVANFALVGGFLPLYAVTFDDISMIYTVMAYLLVLNGMALLVSLEQGWTYVKYVSFVVNTLGTGLIVFTGVGYALLNLCYAVLTFALYVFIALLHPMRTGRPLELPTFLMILLNTVCNVGFLFGILARGELDDYMGALALALAAFYYLFSAFLDKRMPDVRLSGLYLATSLVFAVLVVPLQFDERWISMGWLVEGVTLLLIGFRTREKWYLRIGSCTYVLSLVAFVLLDLAWDPLGVLPRLFLRAYPLDGMLLLKQLAITGLTLLTGFVAWRSYAPQPGDTPSRAGWPLQLGKYHTMVLTLFTLSHTLQFVLSRSNPSISSDVRIVWTDFNTLYNLLTLGYSVLLLRLPTPSLRDRWSDFYTMLIQFFVVVRVALYNLDWMDSPQLIPSALTLLLVNAAGFLAIWMFLTRLIAHFSLSQQLHPMVLFAYVLLSIWLILTQQYDVAFNSLLLSLLLAGAALAYILHGFYARSHYTRRVGLGLSIVAVVKLFLIDLAFLSEWQRILSFFGMGVTLLAISYLYQYFSRRVFGLDHVQLDPPPWHKDEGREQLERLSEEAMASGKRGLFGRNKREKTGEKKPRRFGFGKRPPNPPVQPPEGGDTDD